MFESGIGQSRIFLLWSLQLKKLFWGNFISVEEHRVPVRGEGSCRAWGQEKAKLGILREEIREESWGQILEGLVLSCFRVWVLSFRYFVAQWASRDMLRFGTGVKGHTWERRSGRSGRVLVLVPRAESLSALSPRQKGLEAFLPFMSCECRSLAQSH